MISRLLRMKRASLGVAHSTTSLYTLLCLTMNRSQSNHAKPRFPTSLSPQRIHLAGRAAAEAQHYYQHQKPRRPKKEIVALAIAALGALVSASTLVACLKYSDTVEFTQRKRLNVFSSDDFASSFGRTAGMGKSSANLEFAEEFAPESIWPDDHPNTIAVKRVLQRLVESNGLENLDWKVYVLNGPGESRTSNPQVPFLNISRNTNYQYITGRHGGRI